MKNHVVDISLLRKHALRKQLSASGERLNDVQLLAEWYHELAAKIRRSEMLFEHYGIDVGCETLADEVTAFTQVVAGVLAEEAKR